MDKNNEKSPEKQMELNIEANLRLSRREWTVIYNVLVSREYKLMDAVIIMSIVNKLSPLVVKAPSPEEVGKQVEDTSKVVITKKEN